MKFCYKLLAIAVFVATGALVSCAGPSSFSYQNVTMTVTPQAICNACGNLLYIKNPAGAGGVTGAIEMPAGGGTGSCIELTVAVTNAPINPTWTIIPTPNATVPAAGSGTTYPPTEPGPNVGSFSSPTGATNFYCEPSAIPIYTGPALAQATAAGLVNGTTQVLVTNPADPNNPSNVVSATVNFAFQLGAPPTGVLIGINPTPTVVVPLGGTYQFTGYVAGINGFIVATGQQAPAGGCVQAVPGVCLPAYNMNWAVNSVVGGSTQYGSISSTGLYTAPSVYPSATVHSASVTGVSFAYPTIISTPTVVTFP